jgi:hypothetical protein
VILAGVEDNNDDPLTVTSAVSVSTNISHSDIRAPALPSVLLDQPNADELRSNSL